jgi:apolipoprotein N-acyltransferase
MKPLSHTFSVFLYRSEIQMLLVSLLISLGVSPLNLWPIAFPALGLALYLIFSSENTRIFWNKSLLFFSVHYFLSSYWVVNTFNVVVNNDMAAVLLGVMTLFMVALTMAFSMSLCLFFSWRLNTKYKIGKFQSYLAVSIFFVMGEILRSEILGGYPMHFVGYMVGSNDYLIQLASFGSVFLVSFIFVLISQLIFSSRRHLIYGVVLLLLVYIYGFFTVNNVSPSDINIKEVNVRLVNGNLTQHQLLEKQNTTHVSDYYADLSIEDTDFQPELIVWPESVLQYYIQGTYQSTGMIKRLRSFLKDEQILITGGPSIEGYQSEETIKYYSSLFALNNKDYLSRYDKHRLVPWGEYIPFRHWLPESLTNLFDVKDYTHGDGELLIQLENGLRILPLLCAEGHFPQMLWQYQSNQNLIVMIGNEAWLEGTTEPDQYFMNAKFRAVESGLPVLLVSNKGHLAAFDKNGILIAHSYDIDEPAALDSKILVEL